MGGLSHCVHDRQCALAQLAARDLCERDCLSVRMANKSHCIVARLKVLTIQAEPCAYGMEVTVAFSLLLVQVLLFLSLQGKSI